MSVRFPKSMKLTEIAQRLAQVGFRLTATRDGGVEARPV